jgi:hypothetical protein
MTAQIAAIRRVDQLDPELKLSGPDLSSLTARFLNERDPIEASRVRETIVRGFYGGRTNALIFGPVG